MRGSVRTLTSAFVIAVAGVALAGGAAQAGKFKVLASFASKLGINPIAPVLIDSAGNLYTTASQGGAQLDGTAVELKRKAGGYKATAIFRFCGQCGRGRHPSGPLIIDTQGNLYGTADNLVFELSPVPDQKTWAEKILYRFCSQQKCTDGDFPQGGLTYAGALSGIPYDGTSPLYGVTGGGGTNNGGTVFALSNNQGKWNEDVLYNFCSQGGSDCNDGQIPRSVSMTSDGNLYGVTYQGGGNDPKLGGAGVAFELIGGGTSWNEVVLYRFCSETGCADGARPTGNLLIDPAGNLIGVTYLGGRNCGQSHPDGCGVLFKIVPNGSQSQEIPLYAFCKETDCSDGLSPNGGVALTSFGDLLGTTQFGGGNDIDQNGVGGGVLFQFRSDSSYGILHAYCAWANCTDGEYPNGGPIIDGDGNAYGTTAQGGEYATGTVFLEKGAR